MGPAHHLRVNIEITDKADPEHAAVFVGAVTIAAHRPARHQLCQHPCGRLAAVPLRATAGAAGLCGLRCIDALKPHAFAGNLDRVAINDACCSHQISPRQRIAGGDQHEPSASNEADQRGC